MVTRLRSWWQKVGKSLIVVAIIASFAGILVLIAFGYILSWNWTGFLTKTLWDWLQLLVIPIMFAIGGFWLNQIQKSREERTTRQRAEIERKAAEQRAQTEREIASDNQREAALQGYIDKMSELLLKEGLRVSQPEDEVRKIARVRTLTVLPNLFSERKRNVLQFLYEAGLIDKGKSIVDLHGADLSKVYLSEADLSGADLSGANLEEAELFKAHLEGANLSGVYLSGANLDRADLRHVDLSNSWLHGARLDRADLRGANLSGVQLYGSLAGVARLVGANLSGAMLSGFNLFRADLRGANLSEADLSEADLRQADLTGATLSNADLSDAKLSDAKVTPEQLKEARSLQGTTMPDGSTHP